MADHETPIKIAPAFPASTQPIFKDRAELEDYWHEFYSRVRGRLEHLDDARARSEEDARNLWLCRPRTLE